MNKVMTFIKQNLVPVICGVVIVLALVAWLVWPLPGMLEKLQDDMKSRYDQIAQAQQLVTNVQIPGGEPFKGTYETNVIEAAKRVAAKMKNDTDKITQIAAERNQAGRVLVIGGKTIPLLAGQKEENYLPKIDRTLTDPYYFKNDYEKQFLTWTQQLVNLPTKPNEPGTPPLVADIQADLARRAASAAPTNPMFATQNGATDQNANQVEAERTAVNSRANSIRMYLDPAALQRRDWAGKPTPPNESQIYEALIDCWLQQDVVNAISEVNKNSKNVGDSAVKRLERITVGVTPAGASGGSSGMFFTISGGSPTTPAVGTPETTGTMTGRISGAQADVVLMTIVVDVDPAKQNEFIDALYRQNNGYTVLNIKTTIVDPLDAAGNGYLYGNTQCVHLEILVESMLFRTWTTPLMPDPIRTSLGLPALPAPGAAPAPGAPGAPAPPGA